MVKFLEPKSQTTTSSFGLLVLRLVVGISLCMHGWPKVPNLTTWMGEKAETAGALQALAALSEFAGGIGLAVGLLTPIAALGIVCTMATAAYFHISWGHGHIAPNKPGEPYVPGYELALAYFAGALCVLFCGAGKASVDAVVFKDKAAADAASFKPK